ncbi:hypothetical protein MHU86_10761 [Fragilaria crotonensis]|nr:hypothetical protein MHU86_10761 [Fragilaria crotonensis]
MDTKNQIDNCLMMDVLKDYGGNIEGAENWSLKYFLASSCLDFVAEEMTALQHAGHVCGASTVLITPKFHSEMTGEVIKYSWGVAMSVQHKIPLNSKKEKVSFTTSVNECVRNNVLATKTIWKLSSQA